MGGDERQCSNTTMTKLTEYSLLYETASAKRLQTKAPLEARGSCHEVTEGIAGV